jgi:hypothetical protein
MKPRERVLAAILLLVLLPSAGTPQGANTPCACTGGAGAGGFCLICRQNTCGNGPCYCSSLYRACNNCSTAAPNQFAFEDAQTCILNGDPNRTCSTHFKVYGLKVCGSCATADTKPCFWLCKYWYTGGDRTCIPRGSEFSNFFSCASECQKCPGSP